jgi:hypothetical protein
MTFGLRTQVYTAFPVSVGGGVGQTGHSTETRIQEYHQHIWLYHPEKSAMAKHSINLGHCIQFHETSYVTKRSRCMECLIREAVEFGLHPDNMNVKESFSLTSSWKPLI